MLIPIRKYIRGRNLALSKGTFDRKNLHTIFETRIFPNLPLNISAPIPRDSHFGIQTFPCHHYQKTMPPRANRCSRAEPIDFIVYIGSFHIQTFQNPYKFFSKLAKTIPRLFFQQENQ